MSDDDRRALVLMHEADGGPGVLGRFLEKRGWHLDLHLITPDRERPDLAAPFPDWRPYPLLISLGSVRSVHDRETIGAWIDDELLLLREAHEAGRAVLGICFGGQAIAAALGATVEPAPQPEIGWFELDGEDCPIDPGPWLLWHHDLFTVPDGATLLASTPAAPQLFRVGRTVGTQFHPEVDLEHVRRWLAMAPDAYLAEIGIDRDRFLAETARRESSSVAACGRLVDWYLDDIAFVG